MWRIDEWSAPGYSDNEIDMALHLTGQRFGRLLVLGRTAGHVTYTKMRWDCLCDCGTIKALIGTRVSQGVTLSCGCLRVDTAKAAAKDWTGATVGRLTVIRRLEKRKRKNNSIVWECLCECGNTTEATSSDLREQDTRSCGCLALDSIASVNYIDGRSKTPEGRRHYRMRREAAKMERTPPWADMEAIAQVYINCPPGLAVDHVVPMCGRLVSGLHVHNNLQYLTKSENSRKINSFIPQFIPAHQL
jgi:hypothetical protein